MRFNTNTNNVSTCIIMYIYMSATIFPADSADLLPTSDVIKMLEEFNITDNATALPSTVYGKLIYKTQLKLHLCIRFLKGKFL